MRDPVLERNMFRKPEAQAPADGVVSLVKGESDYDRRRRMAAEMLAAAKERQNPENFKTLSEQSRPGVFRPVATGQPQAPQPNTQQQMAQMQAMGFRPVGMADGGYVRGFSNGGLNISGPTMMVPGNIPIPGSEYDPLGNYTGLPEYEMIEVPDTSPKGDRRANPSSLPYASSFRSDEERGIKTIPPREEPKKPEEPEKKGDGDGEKPDLTLDEIRARRAENINLALIQAGLAMAGGQSPNALANIAAGGISGLGAYREAEKERRAEMAEERKYREDKLTREQRADELAQQRMLTREQRTFDTADSNIIRYTAEKTRLENLLGESMDDAQKARLMAAIDNIDREILKNQQMKFQSQRALGYTGENIFSATAQTPVTPAIDFSKLPK